MHHRIFVINPGSTSTKIALFEGDRQLFGANVAHDAAKLAEMKEISDQLPLRMETIRAELGKAGVELGHLDAISVMSGGIVGVPGGVYEMNDIMFEHNRICFAVRHPNTLGPQIAQEFQKEHGGRIFTVNPPGVDELWDVERVSGFSDLHRLARNHPLNQKENCMRYAASQGKRYEEMSLVCCHIGGGVTVAAHKDGKMCVCNDCVNGDGPMAPTRAGWLPAAELVKMCFSGKYTERELYDRITKNGGLTDHLGTSDAREITARIEAGDRYAKLVFDAFIFQLAKAVGGCAAALKGKVDAIIFTGGIAHNAYVVEKLTEYVDWIAPISVQPGEFEMEALAAGAIRALEGQVEILSYTGVPVFQGFDHLKA